MISSVNYWRSLQLGRERSLLNKARFCETYQKNRKYDTMVLINGHGMHIEMFVDLNHPEYATNFADMDLCALH